MHKRNYCKNAQVLTYSWFLIVLVFYRDVKVKKRLRHSLSSGKYLLTFNCTQRKIKEALWLDLESPRAVKYNKLPIQLGHARIYLIFNNFSSGTYNQENTYLYIFCVIRGIYYK